MFKSKNELRNFVWKKLKEMKISIYLNFGKIPNFVDVEKSIKKLFEIDEFVKSKRIFISPDAPQRKLLKFVDLNEKEVYMATPRLKKGFVRVLMPSEKLFDILLNSVKVNILPKIDFALIGSVAVDLKGNRVGKGGGYGDKEIRILRELNRNVIVATNVHDMQVFDDISYLMELHDEKIDIIITPTKIIRCKN